MAIARNKGARAGCVKKPLGEKATGLREEANPNEKEGLAMCRSVTWGWS